MKIINATLSAAAIAATLLAPAQAADTAATVKTTVKEHAVQLTKFSNYWGAQNKTTYLQTWDVSTPAGETFLALCIEPGQNAKQDIQDYAVTTGFTFGAKSSNVDRLFGLFYGSASAVGGGAESLSFQIALWDLLEDDGNLGTGNLIALATDNVSGQRAAAGAIIMRANTMLADVTTEKDYTTKYAYTQYSSGTLQDFVTATPLAAVPEPSTWAMLGLGLALVGFTARRRSKR